MTDDQKQRYCTSFRNTYRDYWIQRNSFESAKARFTELADEWLEDAHLPTEIRETVLYLRTILDKAPSFEQDGSILMPRGSND